MYKYLIISIIILFPFFSKAQNISIQGRLKDSIDYVNLYNSTVMLLQPKDNFLYKFSRTDKYGTFQIKNIKEGRFILLITCSNYADFIDTISIKGDILDIGTIYMIRKEHLLEDVIVKAIREHAVQLIGDTTVFKADSFKVRPNATVEELLKELPGIQVDKYGRISAQGEKVQKVLVDGEEFFGNDPILVTRNLTANMVDKVQLYDRSSDRSKFTGIEDDNKIKTINLELKSDKRNSAFGKVSSGIATDKYYASSATYNLFSDKKKFAIYSLAGNDGLLGVNEDQSSAEYNGKGIPSVISSGIHFDNKWNDDRNYLNSDYKFLSLNIKGMDNQIIQNNLPNDVIITNSNKNFQNQTIKNEINSKFSQTFSDKSLMNISINSSITHQNNNDKLLQKSYQSGNVLLNDIQTILSSSANNKSFNGGLSWQNKITNGITYTLYLNQNYSSGYSNGRLYSKQNFYLTVDSSSLINQLKNGNNNNNNTVWSNTFTIPLNSSQSSHLTINHTLNINYSKIAKNSYNDTLNLLLDTTNSGNYNLKQFEQFGSIFYTYSKNKLFFNAGSNLGYSKYNLLDNFHSLNSLNRTFTIIEPQMKLRYSFSSQHRITLTYTGNNVQPNTNQIQPISNNDDPLNIYIGNPNLKPTYNNTLNFIYMNFKISNRRTILINTNYTFQVNPIVLATSTDNAGINTFKYINILSRNLNMFNSYLIYSRNFEKINIDINSTIGYSNSNYMNYTNEQSNLTSSSSYNVAFGINKLFWKIIKLRINNSVKYNTFKASIQSSMNNKYWTNTLFPEVESNIKSFIFHMDAVFNIQQKTILFPEFNTFIWNAWIGSQLLKNKNLLIKIQLNDILNQNSGIARSANNNLISQENYSTISRYLMLSLNWNFNKSNNK